MTFDFTPAKTVLQAHSADLVLPSGATATAYMQAFDDAAALFQEQNTIKPEDYRLAAQMTVDMAKTLITIALAGLAALVAYTQASEFPPLFSGRTGLTAATFVCFFVSIVFGAIVVSGIWQRGEGRKSSPHSAHWSTKPAARPVNWQGLLGIVAVILFSLLVLLRSGSQMAKGFALSLPGGDRYITSGDIIISGQNLSVVSKKTQDKSLLPPTKPGETDSITISPK
jgi:hypothetical protein